MRFAKLIIPALLCGGLIIFSIKAFVPKIGGDNSFSGNSSSQETNSEASLQESSNSVDPSINSTAGSDLQNSINKNGLTPLKHFEPVGLDKKAVPWGPGKTKNDGNQPTACVALSEKYSKYGAIFLMPEDKIYLTFDLGYEAGYTQDILRTLKDNDIKATFFITGHYIKSQGEIVKQILDQGHTVGSHSLTHPEMPTLSTEKAKAEIEGINDILKQDYGYSAYLFRFPSGAFSEENLAVASNSGFYSVFWSFAYQDWDTANQSQNQEALEALTAGLHQGAVYLLHPMKTNSEILDSFIKQAKEKGYSFGQL